ncbi:ribonuclease Oy [Chelonus insularis]|uniref:ribonuclease Oy n=1 Tax=Chelonus insularis TaxID=460826 RepID=UPI001589A06C|nr:ribonuclease Oy [Chelonus insularis]
MKYHVCVTFVVIIAVLSISAQGRGRLRRKKNDGKKGRPSNSTDFDLFIFTQHWPPTVCLDWKEELSNHTCSFPKGTEEWSIHGIWPTQLHKMGPFNCNKSLPFKPDELKPIEQELKDKWVDVENGTKPYAFWEHEWKKHGTCAAVINEVNSVYKYFKKGLDLFNMYDMKNVLGKVNITPGKQYLAQTILDGIKKIIGTRAQIECVVDKKNKIKYVFEIRICFDKNFNLKDCDGIVNFPTNCPRKKLITYPGTVPDTIQVIQV